MERTVACTEVFIFKSSLCLFVYKITGSIRRRFVLVVGWTIMGFVTDTWIRSWAGTALPAHAKLLRQSWSASTPSPNKNYYWNCCPMVGTGVKLNLFSSYSVIFEVICWLCQDPTLRCGSACIRTTNFHQSSGQTALQSHSHPGTLRSLPIAMATNESASPQTGRWDQRSN